MNAQHSARSYFGSLRACVARQESGTGKVLDTAAAYGQTGADGLEPGREEWKVLLAGGSITELARRHGASETTICERRDAFMQGGQAQLAAGRKKPNLHPAEAERTHLKETPT